jgi:fatty-acyl-CoA synthase
MQGIASQADVEAIEARGLPPDLPPSSYALLRQSAARYADAPALSYFASVDEHARPRRWSYRALLDEVTRTANALQALGGGDQVVAIVLPNLPEMHFAYWGAQAVGIAAPLNYLLSVEAIVDLLQATGARILVTAAGFPGWDLWTRLQPALARLGSVRHVLLVDPAGASEDAGQPAAAGYQVHDFAACLRRQPGDRLLGPVRDDPEALSSMLCTGGTTGAPKLALRRQRNEVFNAWSVAQCLGAGIGPGNTLFCGLPLFHANGLLVTGLLPFLCGAHVLLATPFGFRSPGLIERFWELVAQHHIHFVSAVPTVYSALLQVPRRAHDIGSLAFGLCGAAPMPRALIERFEGETGVRILEGYGLTEGTCVSSLNPPFGERRAGSIGLRLPGQAMEVLVMDAAGVPVGVAGDGEPGQLVIRGANVFAGYLREEQNRGLWWNDDEGQRWLLTGDLGFRDGDGYFWLTGRAKDLIIRGGHNIDPAVIEYPLAAHPDVQFAAAVGRPDAHAGEVPVVYVQPRAGSQPRVDELLALLAARISERAAMPKALHLIAAMPLTAIGKIDKPALRRREAASALGEALAQAGISTRRLQVVADAGSGAPTALIELADPAQAATVAALLAPLAIPLRWV